MPIFPILTSCCMLEVSCSSYLSCRRPARRWKRSRRGTSSGGTSPLRSQRCTAPAGCRSCWCCWSGCRTTAWPWLEDPCRRAWPPSWSLRTSSWWSPLTRRKWAPRSWRWLPGKPAARAQAPWWRPARRTGDEKATNPSFWYVAAVFLPPSRYVKSS